MRGVTKGWWMAGLIPGVIAGSCGSSAFICEDDAGCAGLTSGLCESSGYCSVPDSECRSGRRYAADSGPLSDRCVPEEGSTGAIEGSGSSTGGGDTGSGPLLDDSGTTLPGADSTTEGPLFGPCEGSEPLLLDPFDSPSLDRVWWDQYVNGGITLAPFDAELVATVDEMFAEDSTAYSGIKATVPLPSFGAVGVQILEVPEIGLPGEIYIVLGDGDVAVGLDVHDGNLETFEDVGSYMTRVVVPFDPAVHRWVRMTFDDRIGLLQWETSPDGEGWSVLDVDDEVPPGWVSTAYFEIGAGVWQGPVASQIVAVADDAFVCQW